MIAREALQVGYKWRIELDGNHREAALEQVLGHLAMAGTDFDPADILGSGVCRGLHAMRRNTDGASNFFSPAGIAEEVLTEPLSRHGVGKSVAGEAARNRKSRRLIMMFPDCDDCDAA